MPLHKIEVDNEVLKFLKDHAEPFVDSPNTVLRRILLKPKSSGESLEKRENSDIGVNSNFQQTPPITLIHILEVIYLVKKRGYERTKATNLVADKRGITSQTVIDQYTRQLNKRASEIDHLLESDTLHEFETLLVKNFVTHADLIHQFFVSVRHKNIDTDLKTRHNSNSQRKERDIHTENVVKICVGRILKRAWGEFIMQGNSQLVFSNDGKRVLCRYSRCIEDKGKWFWGVSAKYLRAWAHNDYLSLILENQDRRGYSFILLNSQQAEALFEKCSVSEADGAKKINMRIAKGDGKLHLQEWFDFPVYDNIQILDFDE